jgi:hypothetical protein
MADQSPTRSDLELLTRIGPLLSQTLAQAVRPVLDDLQRQLFELQAQAKAHQTADTQRRHIREAEPDPAAPGCTRLILDNGDVLVLPDARVNELAGVAAVGRARCEFRPKSLQNYSDPAPAW